MSSATWLLAGGISVLSRRLDRSCSDQLGGHPERWRRNGGGNPAADNARAGEEMNDRGWVTNPRQSHYKAVLKSNRNNRIGTCIALPFFCCKTGMPQLPGSEELSLGTGGGIRFPFLWRGIVAVSFWLFRTGKRSGSLPPLPVVGGWFRRNNGLSQYGVGGGVFVRVALLLAREKNPGG